ncbi:MAG TPA: cyclomaltodextrinase C-terminal domain-containing protein, partial [Ferruginibacter sp.]|nr:cyclomaltodextrinase C-terminal domain-containing protein [Ferruginibacter sp.]
NKFTIAGRTQKDQAIYQHIATLANYRKSSSALTSGKFMQYVPEEGVYVYFRYDDKQTIMVVMNTAKDQKKVSLGRYAERLSGFSKMKQVLNGKVTAIEDITLDAKASVVYELLK